MIKRILCLSGENQGKIGVYVQSVNRVYHCHAVRFDGVDGIWYYRPDQVEFL